MLEGLQKIKKVGVGVNIGTTSVKFTEISQIADEFVLEKAALENFELNASSAQIQNKIKSFISNFPISTKNINLSVSGPSTLIRFITLPKMKKTELDLAVKFEAEKHIPFKLEEIILDYHLLSENSSSAYKILIAVAKKDFIDQKIKFFEEIGLKISLIDLDGLATFNTFTLLESKENLASAIIDIGAKYADILFFCGTELQFCRTIELITKTPSGPDIESLILETLPTLSEDMRKSFSYYENQCGENIKACYITGGSAGISGLKEKLSTLLETECKLWNPFDKIKKSPNFQDNFDYKKLGYHFAPSLGAALRINK